MRRHAGQGNDDRDICYFRAVGDEKSFTTKICSEGLLSSMACCRRTLVCTQTQPGWISLCLVLGVGVACVHVDCARKKIDDSLES